MSNRTAAQANNELKTNHSLLSTSTSRTQAAAGLLVISGIAYAVYPALRPFSDEVSLQGAAAFASVEWLVSHLIAMLAFILLGFGLYGVYSALQKTSMERTTLIGLALSWLGICLTLPFYGAEVFGLQVIGQEAVKLQRPDLLELANQIRFGPGFFIILVGLVLLAIGTVMIATAIWKSNTLAKWSGMPLAISMLLYLPQYAAAQPFRVVHGILITIGCFWIAVSLMNQKGRGGSR